MSPGKRKKLGAMSPTVANMHTRPCLSSASRNQGSHSGDFSENRSGSKLVSSGPDAPGRPPANSIEREEDDDRAADRTGANALADAATSAAKIRLLMRILLSTLHLELAGFCPRIPHGQTRQHTREKEKEKELKSSRSSCDVGGKFHRYHLPASLFSIGRSFSMIIGTTTVAN